MCLGDFNTDLGKLRWTRRDGEKVGEKKFES